MRKGTSTTYFFTLNLDDPFLVDLHYINEKYTSSELIISIIYTSKKIMSNVVVSLNNLLYLCGVVLI